MPFHYQFNFKEIFKDIIKIKPLKLGFNYVSWESFNPIYIANMNSKNFERLLDLKELNEPERKELRNVRRVFSKDNTFSEPIDGVTAKKIFDDYPTVQNEVRVFKVKKTDLQQLLDTAAPNKATHRLCVKFGCDAENTGLSLFLTIMKANKNVQLPEYIECISKDDSISQTAKITIRDDDTFNKKTKNYFDKLNQENKYKRKGVAHFIETSSKPNEIGIEEFMKAKEEKDFPFLYLHTGMGKVKINKKLTDEANYNTVVFSHYASIDAYKTASVESNSFYDVGQGCCPPQ